MLTAIHAQSTEFRSGDRNAACQAGAITEKSHVNRDQGGGGEHPDSFARSLDHMKPEEELR